MATFNHTNFVATGLANVGEKVVVERRTGGYDGRGQWIVDQHNTDVITEALFDHYRRRLHSLLTVKFL